MFNGVCTGTNTVRVALPTSLRYVPSSVAKTSGTASVTIAESSIADLRNPVFNISGIASIGDEITFTVARKADCGVLATAKDSIYFTAGAGCSDASEISGVLNTYNIVAPALSLTPPPALVNTVVGATATRTTTITNGGTGDLDTLRFYIVYPAAGIVNTSGTNAITANTVSFTPFRTNGDTLFYKIFGATIFSGNERLSNGETVTISEPIRVAKCNTTAAYGAYWAHTEWPGCQTATGTSSMTMLTGVLIPTVVPSDSTLVGACTPGISKYVYSNTGSGASAGALYNVVANMGFSELNVVPLYRISNGESLSNFTFGARPGVGIALTISTPVSPVAFVANMNQFLSDPDGAGVGLEDLDGDGQFDDLAPGNSFSIYLNRNYLPSITCPRASYIHVLGSTITYNNMCGTAATTLVENGLGGQRSMYNNGATRTTTLDPQVIGGQPFNVSISHLTPWITAVSQAVDSFELTMTLPAGFTYAGNARYRGAVIAPANIVVSGSQLTFYQKALGTNNLWYIQDFTFDLEYDCSGGTGVFNVPFEMVYVNDRSCSVIERMYCSSFNVNALCPTAVCPDGIGNTNISVVRQTLGWTNTTMSTKVSAASLTKLSLSSVAALDTVIITSEARQGTIAYSNLHYRFEINKAAGADVLSFVSGTLNYKAPLGAIVSTPISAPSDASTATLTIWNWNLSSLLGTAGIPATMAAGDSVWVAVTYAVTRANNSQLFGLTKPEFAPDAKAYLYSLDAAVPKYCDELVPALRFIGYNRSSVGYQTAGAAGSLVGCNTAPLSPFFASGHGNSLNPFSGEYRPTIYFDSVVITLPTGVSYNASTLPTYSYYVVSNPFTTNNFTINIPHPIIRGQDLIFENTGNLIMNDFITAGSQLASRIVINVTSNCAAGTTTANLPVISKYYGRDYQWVAPTPIIPSVLTLTSTSGGALRIDGARRPSLSVQNNTGIVQGVNVNHHWDVQINSTGTTTAPYVWMALEQGTGSGGIIIDSVKLLPGLTTLPLTSTYNTTDKWYQISVAGLASGANQQARVFFRYSSCTIDSIAFRAGFNCTGYPTPNPLSFECTPVTTYLKVNPLNSQVQLSVTRQPGGGSSIPLCTVDSTLLLVNSAQAANLVDPYITIFPPAGFTISTPVRVEYPLGSGDYQNATLSALPGGGFQIDLNSHTSIGTNGMLGTANANPAFVPLGGDRQAKIKLDFTTDCDFSSGTSFVFRAYGEKPCGDPAIDNGVAATTSALNITGASAVGSGGGTMSFGTSSVSCGASTVLSLSTVPTGAPTQAGDTIIYTLPPGLIYAGNFTRGTNCATCDVVASASGNVVKIKLQTGVAATSTLVYGFDVAPDGGGCGSVNIQAEFKRVIASLLCSGVPCSSSSVIIASSTSPAITLNKPNLVMSNIVILDTTAWRQANWNANHIKLYYNNNGTQAYTANTDTVEFFCNSTATVPFAKRALTKSLAIGASDSDEYFIMMPIGSCVPGDVITTRIQIQTASGTPQCLCNSEQYVAAGIGLPLQFLKTGVTVKDCAVTIDWTYNESGSDKVASFVIERSNNGADYKTISSQMANSVRYVDVTPNSGKWFYRIKAIGMDGKITYSNTLQATTSQCVGNTITVYPNPANAQLNIVLQGTSVNNQYELIDALGRVVLKGAILSNSNNKLEVSGVPVGAYTIRITTDTEVRTEKVQILK